MSWTDGPLMSPTIAACGNDRRAQEERIREGKVSEGNHGSMLALLSADNLETPETLQRRLSLTITESLGACNILPVHADGTFFGHEGPNRND